MIFYEDAFIIENEKESNYAKICEYIHDLFNKKGDLIYLRSLVVYAWLYCVEGELYGKRTLSDDSQAIDYKQYEDILKYCIDVVKKRKEKCDSETLFCIGYILGIHAEVFGINDASSDYLSEASRNAKNVELAELCDYYNYLCFGYYLDDENKSKIISHLFDGNSIVCGYFKSILAEQNALPKTNKMVFLKNKLLLHLHLKKAIVKFFGKNNNYKIVVRDKNSFETTILYNKHTIAVCASSSSFEVFVDCHTVKNVKELSIITKERIDKIVSKQVDPIIKWKNILLILKTALVN